ncbi:uncharacterized protein LOC121247702 isoform X2 [Juglans microcarpa x Juglans regia]|uniref:uncharacterized protein LOC121247702 isoform X2 n=1 Tax=Juglans microcarpa x Juglans regia TaxID=2249226 RepID=UPI001B7DD40B|nr:uncharacterized protein LOC121247702 isoform X2 [Juglans microcarpa x Juglans regia]
MVKEMDAHDKALSSSMPTKASRFPRVSASDENDQPHQEMGSNIQNSEKFSPKHNMSQTISAAAKVAVPRKKIFAERNEAPEPFFSNTHVPKTPVFESKLNFVNPGTDISDVSSPEGFATDDNEPNIHVANGSLRPYDPLTNFLSPRPKFLRYMPHRRREIFLRREKEIREGIDGLYINTTGSFEFEKGSDEEDDSIRGSLASSDEGSVQKEDEEIEDSDEDVEDSDEEIEEVEEEKGRGLKRVLESLFCFVLLVLSTLYVSSVSIAPSTSLQSLEDLKGGYYNIQNHTSEAFLAMRLESGTNIWDQVQEIQMGLDRGRRRANEERIEEEKMVEDLKTGRVKISEVLNDVVYGNGGESEALEVVEDEKKGAVDELRELTEPQSVDVDEGCEHETVKIGGFSGRNSELQNGETIQNLEAFQDCQAPYTFDVKDHQIIESDITNILIEENDILTEPAEEVHNEPEEDEEVNLDGMGKDKDLEILNLGAEGNLEEALLKHFGTELLLLRAVIGISVFSMILASLVLGFHFKHKKTSGKNSSLIAKRCSESLRVEQEKTVGKYSSLIRKPSSESLRIGQIKTIKKGLVKPFVESVAAEKHCSVLPNGEGVHTECADSFVIHSSFHPMEESSKDDYESRAPTIELLGEFVVGEISSSLRSCDTKNRRIGSEEGNYSVSLQSQPTFPEFSSMDSHSCARYTTEKKVVKREEGGKDGEAKVITTTPVRRSSRIRNRSLTSP